MKGVCPSSAPSKPEVRSPCIGAPSLRTPLAAPGPSRLCPPASSGHKPRLRTAFPNFVSLLCTLEDCRWSRVAGWDARLERLGCPVGWWAPHGPSLPGLLRLHPLPEAPGDRLIGVQLETGPPALLGSCMGCGVEEGVGQLSNVEGMSPIQELGCTGGIVRSHLGEPRGKEKVSFV